MALDDTIILLWCWPIDAAVEGDWALLDPSERARADRFVSPQHRQRFIRAHGGMRRVLGLVLGQRPQDIRIRSNDLGKPVLDGPGPEFNLSHSADLAALGLGIVPKIGVDIEQVRPIEHELLAQDHFSPAECSALAGLPPALREVAFFRTWTRKEAYLKAVGLGLSVPLAGFTVSVARDEAALLSVDAEPGEAARWRMTAFEPASGYVGAVTARAVDWRLERRPASEALHPVG